MNMTMEEVHPRHPLHLHLPPVANVAVKDAIWVELDLLTTEVVWCITDLLLLFGVQAGEGRDCLGLL